MVCHCTAVRGKLHVVERIAGENLETISDVVKDIVIFPAIDRSCSRRSVVVGGASSARRIIVGRPHQGLQRNPPDEWQSNNWARFAAAERPTGRRNHRMIATQSQTQASRAPSRLSGQYEQETSAMANSIMGGGGGGGGMMGSEVNVKSIKDQEQQEAPSVDGVTKVMALPSGRDSDEDDATEDDENEEPDGPEEWNGRGVLGDEREAPLLPAAAMGMNDGGGGGGGGGGGIGGGGMGGYWRQSRPSSPRMLPPEQPEPRPRSRHEPAPPRYNNLGYWRARRVTFYKNGDPYFPGVEFR